MLKKMDSQENDQSESEFTSRGGHLRPNITMLC